MGFSAKWVTQQGMQTHDNRDFCAIALRGQKALYTVVDGSSKGTQSGVLAREYSKALANQFVAEPGLDTALEICVFINKLSSELKMTYPEGRLSFLILLDSGNSLLQAIHAGDCRLGRLDSDNRIEWLSRVHTLANARESACNNEMLQAGQIVRSGDHAPPNPEE